MTCSPIWSPSPGIMVASFVSGPGLGLAGKHERKTMVLDHIGLLQIAGSAEQLKIYR